MKFIKKNSKKKVCFNVNDIKSLFKNRAPNFSYINISNH